MFFNEYRFAGTVNIFSYQETSESISLKTDYLLLRYDGIGSDLSSMINEFKNGAKTKNINFNSDRCSETRLYVRQNPHTS